MNDEDVAWIPATELRARYAARDLSPVEVTEALLARIERVNPSLNAIVTVAPELALEQARSAERAYGAGEAGPLAGVPITIKDLTPTKGVRTAMGSLLNPDWVPEEDAPFVERAYAAGAVLLGKTNTPEMGWKGDSGNRVFGPTHNPWKHGKTAGGSSGGAGAAVAAGLGPLSQGSDGAGSIRIPAGFCGIFGIKPSYGLIPQYPASAVWDLSHLGPMTRTVADSALLLNVVAGADARDRLSWSSGEDYLAACEGDVAGLRVAWAPGLEGARVDPAVMGPVERAARRFEALGCVVEEANPDLPPAWPILGTMWTAAMAGYFRGREDAVRDVLDPGLFAVVERGARIDGAQLAEALHHRNAYYEQMRRFMERYDLLLTPTLPITAFDAGLDEPPRRDPDDETPLDWTPYTYPINITGQPAATVPCGFADDGLPVGLQIVGRWRDDATVFRAAAAFERAAPWADRRPPLENA